VNALKVTGKIYVGEEALKKLDEILKAQDEDLPF